MTDYEWWEYQGILKTIASATLIEAAIKLRLVQDFIRAEDQDVSISELDEEAISGLNIGTVVTGSFPLTLRESCNKIVHATEAKLHWNPASSALGSFDYWSGIYKLWGSKGKDQWQVDLNIPAWCNAMIRLNKAVQVSFDWQHVAKWDE